MKLKVISASYPPMQSTSNSILQSHISGTPIQELRYNATLTWKPGGKVLMISLYFHTNVSREGNKLTNKILDDEKKGKINTLAAKRQSHKL